MPLPANSTISLQGHSRPGEGVTTMPKFAMLVRMTEATLDALQNLTASDKMDFELGDKPGILIRDQFFPMRYDREKDNQELFIRTTMAARPNAPLKLNANVVGKFTVEKVLNNKIAQRVREATVTAKQQKNVSKAKRLEESSAMTNVAQKKDPSKKPAPQSTPTIVKSYASTAPNATTSTSGPSSAALPKEMATTYRQRLVHYLALGAATRQDVLKEFGGQEVDHDIRTGIMDILIAVAQQEQKHKGASASQDTKWELKPQSWLEVRPYQFSGYTENVRTKVARHAKNWLFALKIPDTDPVWEYMKFRAHGHGGASDAASSTPRATNGITSATAKAKAKGKEPKTKDPGMKSKSEVGARKAPVQVPLPTKSNIAPDRAPTPLHSAKGKEREVDTEKEEGELSASQTPPRIPAVPVDRRQPGSRPNGASTPSMKPPPIPASSQPSLPLKRTGPVDARGPKRAPPEPSERARAAPPIPPPVPAERNASTAVKKEVNQPKVRPSHPADEIPIPASRSSIQPEKERKIAKREREWEKESDRESLRIPRREKERESDRESLRVPRREKERESDRESLRVVRKEKERESDRESIRMRDRSRAPSDREVVTKRRDREYEVVKEKKLKEREQVSRPVAKSSAKRKTPDSSDEESSDWGYEDRSNIRKSSLKATKRDWEGAPAKTSASSSKPVKRESPPPKQRIKRETSPPPPAKTKVPADRRITVASSSVAKPLKKEPRADELSRPTTSKSLKKRRASYDYTSSSEDEAPEPKILKSMTKTVASSHPAPTKNGATASTSATPEVRPRKRKPAPKLSRRDQLRSRYNSKYTEYMAALQKLVAQKNKLKEALRNGSESASGDSDMDFDLPPLEEIQRVTEQHKRLHDELEEIRRSYMA
ncbi:uncharacterized protein FOMMEDRAFT_167976 [Fomitiporia mediterranea MF3/22]|uniref:uncharacterized protein n=1 Tax=Fomitiporia mediterranea (strain MF3/22) TaxID=694068 RepID=UPI00044072C4|nr:uncharacterized protein FOMMEDRAFT_167976 [Fomitiporia mediterranea MF3/22]EJD02832.1 hypothetical protein FOMMEDRAFT_167976 [Fomitiporia mediterranea MF3/22]